MYNMKFFYKREVLTKTWIFGSNPDEWPQFLKDYGWRIIEDVGGADLAEDYVKPTGREFKSTPIERIIFAEKI